MSKRETGRFFSLKRLKKFVGFSNRGREMASANLHAAEAEDVMVRNLAQANCCFAAHVHRKLAADGGNIFFSPFSLSVAMSMLLRGTKESTAEEIMKGLCFDASNLSPDEIHEAFGRLMSSISESKETYILAIANALACQKSFELMSEYKNDLQTIYKAEAWETDFSESSQKAVGEINDWVKTNTRGMIPNLLDSLDPSTVLVLLNAVYFKGTWEHTFHVELTRPRTFYNRGLGSMTKLVPMMSTKEHFLYMEAATYKAVEMPYKGDDIAMLIFLPHEKDGLDELEKNLGDDFLKSVREKLNNVKGTVVLPKLRLEYSKSMKAVFKDLGMTAIFDFSRANFKGLSESDNVEVSDVIHKALIDVNEEGCEAGAATEIKPQLYCLNPDPEFIFVADHPFLFAVYNKCKGVVFFMGRVFEL